MNVASVEGLEGTAGGSAYNASKGGVVILTKNLAIDYGRRRHPGERDLPRLHRDADAGGGVRHAGHGGGPRRRSSTRTSSAGSARPEEIAAAALFLVSADASFVTGSAIAVDGGYTAGRDHGVAAMLGLG